MPPLPKHSTRNVATHCSSSAARKGPSGFQIPRLRSCRGPLSTQQDLAAELREDIDTFARQVEVCDCLLRKDARTALLESKRTIDSLSKSNREDFRETRVQREGFRRRPYGRSDNVTEAMQRTMALMEGELKRSVLSAQMLADSTATLRSTSSTHDTLTTVMDTSKHLITALEKSDWLDRVLIFAALLFFILVVLFILKQRIFDRGIRMAFWWTRFVPDFSGDDQLLSMEKGSAALLSTTAASAVSSAIEPTPLPEPTPETLLDVSVLSDTESPVAPTPEQTVHVEL
ncbi:Sec20-domain-containing protein [Mycena galopus ATCC 62051]|nr:Sec20-domain-containing protein [Mycena galopus ATCC 62051]